jgi:hypothetical protein
MSLKIGMNAKLYWNSGTYASPVWEEVTNAKDVTLGGETGQADVTTRGNNGWRATVATLRDATIDFEMVWDTEDANFEAFRDAWLTNTAIEVLALDGDKDVAGHEGLRATCMVVNFSRGEPLEEAITVSVSVKPTYSENAPEWYETA